MRRSEDAVLRPVRATQRSRSPRAIGARSLRRRGFPPGNGDLVNLELSDNNLNGEIPKDIAKLTNLLQLELYNNSLTGELPAGFGKLTKLQYLDASMNNLTGELPQRLGSRCGPIPRDMCKQGAMFKLLIGENNFSGGIPATYAGCKTLQRFRSAGTGSPATALPNVNVIDLDGNQFTGGIGDGIGNAAALTSLLLARNGFSGPIPFSIGNAANLEIIDLSSNQISRQIPESIGRLARLNRLYLSENRIRGSVP
ncbi:hypothetical protein EJB05_24942, partial [Eragrostis curvula]